MRLLNLSLKTAAFAAVILSIASFSNANDATVPAENHIIEIIKFKFVPSKIDIKAGDTITWINRDIVPHTATFTDEAFDTGSLALNESYTYKVLEIGGFHYFCRFHPSMRGALKVD